MLRPTHLLLGISALAALVSAPVSAAREPVLLKPAGEWSVDFGEARCRLARIYGTGDNRHGLFIQQWQPSGGFAFTVAGPSFNRFQSRRATFVRFREGQDERETTPFVGGSESFGKAVIYTSFAINPANVDAQESDISEEAEPRTGLPQLNLDDARSVEFIELRQFGRVVRLEVDALDQAFEVMNTCTKDLVRDWGLDVEKHRTATRRVSMSNFDAIARRVASNYPRNALNRGEQAILRVRIAVNAQGKATDCIINEVTRANSLESPACKPLMQGTYLPALDADGKPFASYFATSITYVIG